MERKLMCVYESEKAIVRVYSGPKSDTPEKLRALLEPSLIRFVKALCRENPEILDKLTSSVDQNED